MERASRVLIVEDDPDFARSLAAYLEIYGHDVEIAASAEEGLARFVAGWFDLTVIDITLPGMDGVASFFEIRKVRADAPVVLMTAHRVEQRAEEAVRAGALEVLRKPFDPDAVRRLLEST